jgi:hypothetical protein
VCPFRLHQQTWHKEKALNGWLQSQASIGGWPASASTTREPLASDEDWEPTNTDEELIHTIRRYATFFHVQDEFEE